MTVLKPLHTTVHSMIMQMQNIGVKVIVINATHAKRRKFETGPHETANAPLAEFSGAYLKIATLNFLSLLF